MAEKGGDGTTNAKPRALAFYLPQYHPIPENDRWWGAGFTEWNNVTKARPLFPGHYQPHGPGELGYYDLRLPEVREAQAALARSHGVAGFVYYHYWFNGKRLLQRPFDEVLASGSPDLPFALCWANEEWTRNWDGRSGDVLVPQNFSASDDLAHIRWLLTAFADQRYITIDGRPLMLIYRPQVMPDVKRTTDLWRTEAQKAGFPDLYLCWVEQWGTPAGGPQTFGFDATVGFMPPLDRHVFTPVDGVDGHRILDYESSARAVLGRPAPPWKRFPSVMVGWDNTARRPQGATVFAGSTPEAYRNWLQQTVSSVAGVRAEENYLFIVAWNEWAEGNHLEPDQRFGRAFLEATRTVLLDHGPSSERLGAPPTESGARQTEQTDKTEPTDKWTESARPGSDPEHDGSSEGDNVAAAAAALLRALFPERRGTIVDLGGGPGSLHRALANSGIPYLGLDINPEAVTMMQSAGIDARECDLTDLEGLQDTLETVPKVGALAMIDVLGHLVQPQQLLSMLSSWSLKHDAPALVLAVPNVGHFDLGLRLLFGRWIAGEHGAPDRTDLRFFTEETLERLVERCGWQVTARDNVESALSDLYDLGFDDAMPADMVVALRTLAECYNPDAGVSHFVWAMRPVPVTDPPTSYRQAVAPIHSQERGVGESDDGDTQVLERYLRAVGLVAAESNRPSGSHWWTHVIAATRRSPRLHALVTKIHGWTR